MENLMEGKHSMNKGIELLLARRKTHPEEFVGRLDKFEFSRWNNFLRTFRVDLNQSNTYPVAEDGEKFTKEVMRRLLTAYDLERKGGALTRAEVLKELLPGFNDLFGKEYAKYGEEIKEKFNE